MPVLISWVERSTVGVKCILQEHITMSPSRARTQNAQSTVQHCRAWLVQIYSCFWVSLVFCKIISRLVLGIIKFLMKSHTGESENILDGTFWLCTVLSIDSWRHWASMVMCTLLKENSCPILLCSASYNRSVEIFSTPLTKQKVTSYDYFAKSNLFIKTLQKKKNQYV